MASSKGVKRLVAGAAAGALLCIVAVGHGATRSVDLADVAVASSAFPSYYGGARNHPKVFTQYPTMNAAGGQSLAMSGQQGIQSLAGSPECGSVVVTSSLCTTTMIPGGGMAAMPFGYPGYGAAPYGATYGGGYGAPVGMNAYQAPTVWQGDHVVSGGQPEWAAEDAAQHALNLANWRIKLLQAKLEQAKLAAKVMNVATPGTSFSGDSAQLQGSHTQTELKAMQTGLVSLATSTSDAIESLSHKIGKSRGHRARRHRSYLAKLRQLKQSTDSQLSTILKKIDRIAGH